MSAEDIIRDKHRFENELAILGRSLQKWRQSFALLSTQELELATARVLDKTLEDPGNRSMKLKLLLPSAIMKRRTAGYRVSAFRRFWLLADPKLLIDTFVAAPLHLPAHLDDEGLRYLAQSE